MEKTNEISMTLDDMISCGQKLSDAARELYSCGELMIRLAKQLQEGDSSVSPAQEQCGYSARCAESNAGNLGISDSRTLGNSARRAEQADTEQGPKTTTGERVSSNTEGNAAPETEASAAQNAAPMPETAQAADPPKTWKLEDIRAILAHRSSEGHREEVKGLLKKYGASKLSEISPEHYAALAAEAEALGHAG